MTNEIKAVWLCVLCCSRDRKGGDNSDTPVRVASTPQHDYVTHRTKTRVVDHSSSCMSAEGIRDIIREELQNLFKMSFLPKLMEVQNAVSTLESSLSFFNEELERIRSVQGVQSATMKQLERECEDLRVNNRGLMAKVAFLDQQSRSSNIEIQCVPEHKQENLMNIVQQLGRTIKCAIGENSIQHCSRMAKLNSTSPRPRSILVRFNSQRLRDEFLACTTKFNKSNQNDKLNTSHLGIGGNKKSAIYVAEHLSPENKALHAAARTKAKELNYRYVWVRDGRIYMRKNDESKYLYVKNIDLLNNLS